MVQPQSRPRIQPPFAFVVSMFVLIGLSGLCPTMSEAAPATPTATAPPQFGIGPVGDYPKGFFVMSLKPGTSGQFTFAAVNTGKTRADLKIYAANAVNPANGGFAADDDSVKPAGATAWVTLPETQLNLEAGTQQALSFTINVPVETAPGQYITAVVASTVEALPVPGSTTFNQIIRSTLPIEINVPGPVKPGFTLGHPVFQQYGTGATLSIPISNTGNVLVKPAGKLTVKTPDGKTAITAPVKMQSVYAGNTTQVELNLPTTFKPGDYVVTIALKDSATGASAKVTNAKATLSPPSQ